MPSQDVIYGYDAIGRLSSLTFGNGDTVAYSYDAVGNRTSVVINGPPPPPPPTTTPIMNGFRFSLSSSDPAPASDVLAATTGYLVPFSSDSITLLNSSGSEFTDSSDGASVSISFSTFVAGNVYRIFASDPSESGTIGLSAMEWTSISNPGTALNLEPATPGGFLVLASNQTKRYIADVYCGTNGKVNDAAQDRGVFNAENRILRQCQAIDLTNSWTMTTLSTHARNNNTTQGVGRFGVMIGLAEDAIEVSIIGRAHGTSANSFYRPGFGVDSTSTFVRNAELVLNPANVDWVTAADFTYLPTVGRHFFQALEAGTAGTYTVWGGTQVGVLEAIVRM